MGGSQDRLHQPNAFNGSVGPKTEFAQIHQRWHSKGLQVSAQKTPSFLDGHCGFSQLLKEEEVQTGLGGGGGAVS